MPNRSFQYHFYKTYLFGIKNIFTHPSPKFGCINGTCTGVQPDKIVHRIQRAFTFKMMSMDIGTSGGVQPTLINNALIDFTKLKGT